MKKPAKKRDDFSNPLFIIVFPAIAHWLSCTSLGLGQSSLRVPLTARHESRHKTKTSLRISSEAVEIMPYRKHEAR